jgi:hypothetical protein
MPAETHDDSDTPWPGPRPEGGGDGCGGRDLGRHASGVGGGGDSMGVPLTVERLGSVAGWGGDASQALPRRTAVTSPAAVHLRSEGLYMRCLDD